jgi:hypothetical protein
MNRIVSSGHARGVLVFCPGRIREAAVRRVVIYRPFDAQRADHEKKGADKNTGDVDARHVCAG